MKWAKSFHAARTLTPEAGYEVIEAAARRAIERIEEFEPEKEWWGNREETEQAWRVSIETIQERNFHLDIKNPNAPDNGPGDPDKLLRELRAALEEAAGVGEKLKAILQSALEQR